MHLERLEVGTACHGPEHRAEVAAKIADAEARIAELEADREELEAAPPPVQPSAVSVPVGTPANDVPVPEYVGTRAAAALLGISARTLEGLRARGEGPPCVRIGRRVVYPIAALRSSGK